jgi:hypothetical protein
MGALLGVTLHDQRGYFRIFSQRAPAEKKGEKKDRFHFVETKQLS